MTTNDRPRPRCTYRLDYLGRHYCRFRWCMDIMSEPQELHHGCPVDCSSYKAAFGADLEPPQVAKSKDGA